MDRKSIGKRLQTVRESLGFTQEQVARYLGTRREVVSYFETGARPIGTLTLQKLADLYGYRFSYFVDETLKPEEPHVSMAFRVSDLSDKDLFIIAQVKKIAHNLDSLYRLLGGQGSVES
ncbi:MAG: helix-turn-helix transcriptional regulator [Dehalococcoidia bacterium]|nr:helix-turn-helix transcriptional regulator [Dehalococcoidia bacterium]MCK4263217.1 helix-turn-helix transcriptional regulator [Dehalococcoidia bacterium]